MHADGLAALQKIDELIPNSKNNDELIPVSKKK
jgi:hypothetical protein